MLFSYFFKEIVKGLKITWKGIKNISLESSNYTSPNALVDDNITLKEPITIDNAFNKYFSASALDIQSSI